MATLSMPEVSLGLVLAEADCYLRWLADPVVTHFLEHARPMSFADLKEYTKARERDSIFKGIYADGEYVGNIKAGPLDRRHHHADIGIMIGEKDWWGKGVGTAAIKLMLEECRLAGLHMVTAGIIDGNIGSICAFHNVGFTQVGRLPEYRFLDGEYRDELLFAYMLKQDA